MPDRQNRGFSGGIRQVKCFSELNGHMSLNLGWTWDALTATIMIVRRTLAGKNKIERFTRVAKS
jgi:hypothetical protein